MSIWNVQLNMCFLHSQYKYIFYLDVKKIQISCRIFKKYLKPYKCKYYCYTNFCYCFIVSKKTICMERKLFALKWRVSMHLNFFLPLWPTKSDTGALLLYLLFHCIMLQTCWQWPSWSRRSRRHGHWKSPSQCPAVQYRFSVSECGHTSLFIYLFLPSPRLYPRRQPRPSPWPTVLHLCMGIDWWWAYCRRCIANET